MLVKYLRILLLALFTLPINSFAEEAFDLTHLQNLFKSYQRQQAYEYAYRYIKQMEGDPYFDYLFGVSAIDTGHASEGVFALERVLLFYPQDHVARLELAKGYFILEEYARARQEFETLMKLKPARKIQETAQLFLDKIRLKEARYRTTSGGYIELSMGRDSNVNTGADEDKLLPSTISYLDAEGLAQDDTFSDLALAFQTTHPVAPGWLANAGITSTLRKNTDLDQFNTLNTTLQAGITRLSKESRYKAELVSQLYQVDGENFRTLNGINFDWRYATSQKSSLTTTMQYVLLDYTDRPVLNSSLTAITLSYSHSFATLLTPTIFTSVNIGSGEPEKDLPDFNTGSTVERDIMGLNVGIMLGLSNKTALQFSTGIQNSQYAEPYPTGDGSNREDDHISSNLNLLWLFTRDWRLDARLSNGENQSNVDIFRYSRTQFSLNLNYAF